MNAFQDGEHGNDRDFRPGKVKQAQSKTQNIRYENNDLQPLKIKPSQIKPIPRFNGATKSKDHAPDSPKIRRNIAEADKELEPIKKRIVEVKTQYDSQEEDEPDDEEDSSDVIIETPQHARQHHSEQKDEPEEFFRLSRKSSDVINRMRRSIKSVNTSADDIDPPPDSSIDNKSPTTTQTQNNNSSVMNGESMSDYRRRMLERFRSSSLKITDVEEENQNDQKESSMTASDSINADEVIEEIPKTKNTETNEVTLKSIKSISSDDSDLIASTNDFLKNYQQELTLSMNIENELDVEVKHSSEMAELVLERANQHSQEYDDLNDEEMLNFIRERTKNSKIDYNKPINNDYKYLSSHMFDSVEKSSDYDKYSIDQDVAIDDKPTTPSLIDTRMFMSDDNIPLKNIKSQENKTQSSEDNIPSCIKQVVGEALHAKNIKVPVKFTVDKEDDDIYHEEHFRSIYENDVVCQALQQKILEVKTKIIRILNH
ncbi:laminin subunit alpha [Acrasis kona]|uniref:Laminin subunit alpha n=2 Tax=Acrasis kona TaxID=1008807 RepID=A0AAW2ZNG3_9EUKA